MYRSMVALLAVMAVAALAAAPFATADEEREYRGRPGRGPGPGMMGPGYGMGQGPGMMGEEMGPGMMGFGPGMGAMLAQLPPEKRDQVFKVHLGMRRQMIAKSAALQTLRLDLVEIMRAYPIDQTAARSKFDELAKLRGEIFAIRMAAMASIQQIVGEKLWREHHLGDGMMGWGGGGRGFRHHHE